MAVHLEDIIEQTGGCGRYQIILCLIVHCCKQILCFSLILMVFAAKVPDWWCMDDFSDGSNFTWPLSTDASQYQSCTNSNGSACRVFKFEDYTKTIVSEWGLVCENDWVTSTIMSVQMAGVFVGNLGGGQVADLIGRKPPLYGAMTVMTLLSLVTIFSSSWIMFVVIRFFIGFAAGFHLTVMYNIQSEFVLAHWRTLIVALPSWHIATGIFALTAWLLHDWVYINIVAVAVGFASVATCWFVPESFRWKVVHDKVDDATNIIRYVARVNRSPVPDTQVLQELAESVKRSEHRDKDRQYSLLDLVRSREIFRCTVLLMIVWLSLGLGSYGIQFGVQALSGSFYVNIVISSAINAPLQFVQIYLQNRFGRKKVVIMFFTIFTVFAAVVGIMKRLEASATHDNVSRISALLALTAIDGAWSPVQTLTIELYPTVIRNIGYGYQNTMSRLGAIIGPQLVLLDTRFAGTMYYVCAVIGLVSILLVLRLPETRGTDLQDKMPDRRVSGNEIV